MITHQLNSKKVMEHLLMLIVLAIAVTSCSNEENEMVKFGNKDSDIVVYAENFGKMHNECLDYCYEQLVSVKLRSKKTFTSEKEFNEGLVKLVNQYIEEKKTIVGLKSHNESITLDFIASVSNEDIREKMNSLELSYIDQTLLLEPNNKKALQNLQLKLLAEKNLTDLQKKAVASFISVYQKSSEYWITKHSYWMDLKMQSIDQFTTTKAAAWVVADCYWGWFGTVSSGGNGLVGAGAAAVASACAAL